MSQLLSATAFGLLIGAQFLAVIAVHRLKQDAGSSAHTFKASGLSDHGLHIWQSAPTFPLPGNSPERGTD